MKYENVILTLHFTLQDENMWKRKIPCEILFYKLEVF